MYLSTGRVFIPSFWIVQEDERNKDEKGKTIPVTGRGGP
jgi:hypothetical protein